MLISVCLCVLVFFRICRCMWVSYVFRVWVSWVFRELPTMQWILNERRLLEQILNGTGICVSHSTAQYGITGHRYIAHCTMVWQLLNGISVQHSTSQYGIPDTGTLHIVQCCNSFWMVLVYSILHHSITGHRYIVLLNAGISLWHNTSQCGAPVLNIQDKYYNVQWCYNFWMAERLNCVLSNIHISTYNVVHNVTL